MSQMFVRGIAEIAEALVAMRRLRKFLEYDEKRTFALPDSDRNDLKDKMMKLNGDTNEKEKLVEPKPTISPEIAVSLKNVTCTWTSQEKIKEAAFKKSKKIKKVNHEEPTIQQSEDPPTLSNISIDIRKGHLVGIIGHVGSGKSSLLQVILKEIELQSGSLVVRGSTAYTNQEPWIFNSSIRQNILFGLEYDKERYDKTVAACGLDSDFKQFPYSDLTLVGERTLSGGQKARVSLARAVYRAADIILLDDPLSAVGKWTFNM